MTLAVERLSIASGARFLFKDLSFSISPGEILSVMGPSGSGKTSLLNAIAGHLDPSFTSTGSIKLEGVSLDTLPVHRRRIGLQFQDHLLFPHMTVGENLAFGLPRKNTRTARRQKIQQALISCGLENYEDYDPSRLSGGQKARISLMRTLLSEPGLLLLDEPFSKLDTELREQFRCFVFEQIKSRNIPALMVTHDLQDLPDNSPVINLKHYFK